MGKIRAETIEANSATILTAVTDPHPPKSGFEGAQVFPDSADVIVSDVDAVFVCTPNRFAPDLVIARPSAAIPG
jgi:predicted dehydrogenase